MNEGEVEIASNLAQVVEHSRELSELAMIVFGASVLTILSASYRRPFQLRTRMPYLLFVPGWVCIAYSLIHGNELSGSYLASLMVGPEHLRKIGRSMNDAYGDQRDFLLYGLAFFAIWLSLYIFSWVFQKRFYEEENEKTA